MSSTARPSKRASSRPAPGGSGSSRSERPVLERALARVARFAGEERIFRRVQRVLVALSGGPDSLACLLVLRELGAREGFSVLAAHFDHQLRPESRAELDRVRALCEGLGVACVTGEGDVRDAASRQRMGIEEMARQMRYQFLAFVAGKENAGCVATGHTADDQAETVLMRILRGTGIRGLRGMLPVSGVPGAETQRLVRPLLVLDRATTEAVCAEAGLEPIADASNTDSRYRRNRVRLETLPALRAINPSIDDALRNLGTSAREAFEGIERQALEARPTERGTFGAIYMLDALRSLPTEALTLVIEREAAFAKVDAAVNRTRLLNLAHIMKRGSGAVAFAGCEAEVSCGRVRIGAPIEEPEPFEAKVLNIPGSTGCGPWRADVALEALPPLAGSMQLALRQAAIRGVLRLRPALAGDRIRLRGVTRRLSDAFVDERVPRWQRTGALVISDADGPVAAIGAFGVLGDAAREGGDALHIRLSRIGDLSPRVERLDAGRAGAR